MGVFRIARAEFIKIFKKPSVYIMGVILASVLVLSLLFFEPVGKQDYSVNLSGPTIGNVYDKFTNDNNTLGGDYKKSKFDAVIQSSVDKLDFYTALNNRSTKLHTLYSEFNSLFVDLSLANSKENNATATNEIYENLKKKIDEYIVAYNNVDSIKTASNFYNLFCGTSTYKSSQEVLNKIKELTIKNVSEFISYMNNNTYFADLNKIVSNNNNYIKLSVGEFVSSITKKFTDYSSLVFNNPSPSYEEKYLIQRNLVLKDVKDIQAYVKALVDNPNTLAFVKKADYESFTKLLTDTISVLESFEKPENSNIIVYKRHENIVKALEASKFYTKIATFNNSIINYSISNKSIDALRKTITTKVTELKDGLMKSINTLNETASSTDINKLAQINDLITSYRVLSINTTTLVNNTISLEATSIFNSDKINDYYTYDKYNKYESKEEITRSTYYIKNGTYNQSYSDVFAFNKNSGKETSAYDFMFYAMKIATLIISAFAILMAASLMASEYDSGTIKLLAMRPFKRWKILTGKLFATMFFVLVFILFSFIISFVAGICLYPLTTAPVLAVINGQLAVAMHPILLMLINLISIILEVFFYTILALSISTIFRSYTAAISISFVTFILGLSLNILFGGAFWYSFIPFINTNFFRFFGGSFLDTQSGTINLLFTNSLLSNSSLYISLGIYGGTLLIFILLTHLIFKRRDF